MKYIDEFREHSLAQQLANAIKQEADNNRTYRLMEFCGGHTHAIFRYGIQDLLPDNVEFIHGPGCPVCVLPMGRIDNAIELVEQHDVILCIYADLLRVPASLGKSLLKAKASGGDIRMIYSTQDALKIARDNPNREVVFFAIGFETTTPPTAVAIKQASEQGLKNFSIFCNHVLTPSAMQAILDAPEPVSIDGFLGPSHVSTIIGSQAYEIFAQHYLKPIVIAGFEPLDVMQSSLMLIRQLNTSRHQVENEYTRAVTRTGNVKAQSLMNEVFCLRDEFEWRGLGLIPKSALKLRANYAQFDAELRFQLPAIKASDVKGCECPAILRGAKRPVDCKLLGTVCTPENPMGSCMVSSEGACAAYWSYGRLRGARTNKLSA
ncbi:hydrogenase formation protein HupD [Methyloprofundus sedimenti]|uniref:Hydrogenase maturation factor n=1 Tax=Methyloprofundus sedimenti TaxID=1420851 RepID=A0A1V8M1H9_9GAMM|nr:hydrogenase formation protein HypD [Methyloprofundus sedimenti]OQK15417.1 hydrogenase formation protein HupD [Methyloprofundus sedimenti]